MANFASFFPMFCASNSISIGYVARVLLATLASLHDTIIDDLVKNMLELSHGGHATGPQR